MKNRKWTMDEINFLKENYSKKGSNYCAKFLNRNVRSITNKSRW